MTPNFSFYIWEGPVIKAELPTMVSVYSSSFSGDTSLWCFLNRSPRKAYGRNFARETSKLHMRFVKCKRRYWNGSGCNCAVVLGKEHFVYAAGRHRAERGSWRSQPLTLSRSLLLAVQLVLLCEEWTFHFRWLAHLELLRWYVATAVDVVLPPCLQGAVGSCKHNLPFTDTTASV